MPQKKNPEVLEVIRARTSYALGDFVASAAALKSLPTTYNLDFQEVTPKLWASTDNLASLLSIFSKLVPNLKMSQNINGKAEAGFVGATELANLLVRKYNVAFRTSHKIVGALVKSLIDSKQTLVDATPELLHKIAQNAAGIELMVKKQDMTECTNPSKIIETYKVQGGPSPVEVERAISTLKKNVINSKNNIARLKQKLADAESTLSSIVDSYSLSSSPSSAKLKNPTL
jgi:argininosuccinate lyase